MWADFPLPQSNAGVSFRPVKLLGLLIIASLVCALPACSSGEKKNSKGTARMYDGDESPHIRMYTEAEGPGSELHN
jgi:hypothetical protein